MNFYAFLEVQNINKTCKYPIGYDGFSNVFYFKYFIYLQKHIII